MKKDMKGLAKIFLVPASLSAMVLLAGCGGTFGDKTTKEAKKYEASQAIDSGDFDKAIEMLEKDCAGFSYEECQLNLGAAYMGKAGYDLFTIGSEIMAIEGNDGNTDDDKEKAITSLLFDKLFDDSLGLGIAEYKVLLDNNGSECNFDQYDTLTAVQKHACTAINPILLMEKLSGETTGTSNTVDLETIIAFKAVLDAAIPGLTTEDVVAVLSGGELPAEKDLNGNGTPDELEVTNCAISAYSSGAYDSTACDSVTGLAIVAQSSSVDINGSSYEWLRLRVSDATASATKDYIRLVTDISTTATPIYTTVTATDNNITSTGAACSNRLISDPSGNCFPEPEVDESGNVGNFGDVAVDILNNDSVLESVAQMSDTTGDTDSAALRADICTAEDNTDLCPDGDTVTQDAVLNYLQQTK